jgi:N,N-dimethylformamidase beta subunit-like, C-terminal
MRPHHHSSVRSLAATAALLFFAAAALGGTDDAPDGHVRTDTSLVPAVEAAFRRESYRPGQRARLIVTDRSRRLTVQVLQAGPELDETSSDTEMNGVPVTPVKTVERRPGRQPLSVPIGGWPSGLYYARLEAPDGRVGFAPFVVAPRHLGIERVAVVLPTLTWQAYNFRDDDGDGGPDSWYADKRLDTVRLGRAFLDRGVPYGLRFHLGFLHWLSWTGKRVDVLSQADLERVSNVRRLRRAYDLIVFAGHHEYVTTREYDVVERYRNRGGNLMFLSANSYFWRVIRQGDVIRKSRRWRNLDRPESSLIGAQYIAYQRSPRKPWSSGERRPCGGS